MITLNEIGSYVKNGMDIRNLLIIAAVAVLGGLFTALVYYLTHKKKTGNMRFYASLVLTCVIAAIAVYAAKTVAAVIIAIVVIGVGSAMRIAITKDEEDERIFMIWAAAAGICAGQGEFVAMALVCIIAFIIFMIFGLIIKNDACLVIVKGLSDRELDAEGTMFRLFKRKATLKSKVTDSDHFELIYEVSAKTITQMEKRRVSVADSFLALGGIESVRILSEMENDEE